MPFMEWSEKYSIGVPVFDEEHKRLIGLINALHDQVSSGADGRALNQIVYELIEYTFVHFGHEEVYFHDSGYPEAEQHTATHVALKRQVFDYRARIAVEDCRKLAAEMLTFLRGWLAQHILIEDRKYGEYLTAKGYRWGAPALP